MAAGFVAELSEWSPRQAARCHESHPAERVTDVAEGRASAPDLAEGSSVYGTVIELALPDLKPHAHSSARPPTLTHVQKWAR